MKISFHQNVTFSFAIKLYSKAQFMSKRKQREFMRLYEPVHEGFERFCRARTYAFSDHRDLMNETLLVAFKKFEGLEKHDSFLPFLIGIAIRLVGNQLQKKKLDFSDNAFEAKVSSTSKMSDPDVHFLYCAMSALPAEQKEAILMKELSGLKMKEIAEIQSCSEDAVKQRVKRGKEKLRELLEHEMSYEQRNELL